MTPEKTNFITQGYDGMKRLKQGPMLDSYRGLSIIHSRQYSLETGAPPRDLLRRRVRVAEYYRIPWQNCLATPDNRQKVMIDLYDEAKDTFFTISWKDLLEHAALDEADRVKFDNLGDQPEIGDFSSTPTCFDWHRITTAGRVSVVRPAEAVAGASFALLGNTLDTARNDTAAYWNNPINDGTGLVLVTTSVEKSPQKALYTDPNRKMELQSFYTGSGWFNGVTGNRQVGTNYDNLIYYKSLVAVPDTLIRYDFYAQGPAAPPTVEFRKKTFRIMALGYLSGVGNQTVQLDRMRHVNFGLRPNLHIGKMAFAHIRPDTMRFKHVAGHIMAQTVVTRPLAIRLMDQMPDASLHILPGSATPIHEHILYLFGLSTNMATAQDRHQHFNLKSSVLAYMAAAVLHPNRDVADFCAGKLREQGLDLSTVGNRLVTWIKVFLNSIPAPRGGVDNPVFDSYEQGRVLENTFLDLLKDPERNDGGRITPEKRLRQPVLYLGEYIPMDQAAGVYTTALNTLPAANRNEHNTIMEASQVPRWEDAGDTDLGLYRDVDASTFSKRRAYIFPGGSGEKIRPQDIIAVNKTACEQDCLVAFVTIMCKRFFTSYQEMYVEMAEGAAVATDTNPGMAKLQTEYSVSRRALTSNEYPCIHTGPARLLESPEKWEIVIVRPNIEHNMLAAVLGRGGIEDLGCTFWGQTELSCYDDSMHGVWGMSYKYHERAMVTNEKNLIRLFDIAYDGYNGGKDDSIVSWTEESGHRSYNTLKSESANTTMPYTGPSIMVMAFPVSQKDRTWERNWPSPIVFHEQSPGQPLMQEPNYVLDPDNTERVFDERMRVFGQIYNRDSTDPVLNKRYERYYQKMPNFTYQHTTKKSAGQAVAENESTGNSLAFQGTYRVWKEAENGAGRADLMDVKGSGHHGVDYVGVASVRSGKGYKITGEGLQTVRQV